MGGDVDRVRGVGMRAAKVDEVARADGRRDAVIGGDRQLPRQLDVALCERDEPLLYPLLDDIPDRVSLYQVDSLTCTSHPGLAEEIPSPHL